MINWKVRIRNKAWWLTFVPAVIVAVGMVANALGIGFDADSVTAYAVQVIGVVFAILAAVGVNVDMTTAGLGDSEQAMEYERPRAE